MSRQEAAGTLAEFYYLVTRYGPESIFRGQGEDSEFLLPSYYRCPNPPDGNAASEIMRELYFDVYDIDTQKEIAIDEERASAQERAMVGDLPWMTMSRPPRLAEYYWFELKPHQQAALLQHYGVPSKGLDVTRDPFVALFFATHTFLPAASRSGRYRNESSAGVVYLIRPVPGTMVYSLEDGTFFPSAGLRGQRQRAALLFAAENATDLRPSIDLTIHVSADVWEPRRNRLSYYNQNLLFPPQQEDPFYARLLAARANTRYAGILRWVVEYL